MSLAMKEMWARLAFLWIMGLILIFLLARPAHADPLADCRALLPNGAAPMYVKPPAHHTELCHQPAYVLSHDDDAHEPRWVAWLVTAEHLKVKGVGRTDDFRADPDLPAGIGATPADYAKSGYDQGHMSDADDNGWSEQTEHLSFLMSNMIPQCPACNRQTWRYIENWTRALTAKRPVLYVLSGPLLGPMPQVIGRDKVDVPSASWKLVIDLAGKTAWGFIVPNDAASLKPGSDIQPYLVAPAEAMNAAGLLLVLPGVDGSKSGPL
jgi:endonuclease G, mitochondrial